MRLRRGERPPDTRDPRTAYKTRRGKRQGEGFHAARARPDRVLHSIPSGIGEGWGYLHAHLGGSMYRHRRRKSKEVRCSVDAASTSSAAAQSGRFLFGRSRIDQMCWYGAGSIAYPQRYLELTPGNGKYSEEL